MLQDMGDTCFASSLCEFRAQVTDLTSRYDEKCAQSARLLKQSQNREDLKNALMQKTVHLVELKEAQQEEELALRRRVRSLH